MLARSKRVPENHYEAKSNLPPVQLPTVYFLYSERDKKTKDDASFYFKSLKKEGLLEKVRFFVLEDQPTNWWIEAAEKWDVFVMLVSIHLTNDHSYKQFLNYLKREHQLNRVALIPILVGEAGINFNLFQNVIVFPTSEKALNSGFWNTKDNFYLTILGEMIPVIKEFTEIKTTHNLLWKEKKSENSIEGFKYFLEEYPYSRHAAEAKEKIRKLEEENLIESLEDAEQVSELYEYLVNTPLDEKRDEALAKINEIETDQDKIWEELEENGQLEDFLEYRIKFPYGKYQREVGEKIKEALSKPENVELLYSRKTNTNLLKYLAINSLHRPELLSLETQLDYANFLEGWWNDLLIPLNFYRGFITIGSFSLIVITLALPFMPPSYFKLSVLWAIIGVLALAARGYYFQRKDWLFLKAAKGSLKKTPDAQKIYFIIHDDQSKKKVKLLLNRLDEQSKGIFQKGVVDYMLQKKAIEPFDFDKLLPKRHIIS